MKVFIIALSLFSALSFASDVKEVNFTYFGNSGMNRQYYACSYVENQATSYLDLFGASDIEVYCSGGIRPYSAQPVTLRAKFKLPVVTGQPAENISIEGDTWNPNCGINTKIINEFVKMFSMIKIEKKNDSCAFHNSNFSYQLKINR